MLGNLKSFEVKATIKTIGVGFKDFFFTPIHGEMIQLDAQICHMRWNHQLENHLPQLWMINIPYLKDSLWWKPYVLSDLWTFRRCFIRNFRKKDPFRVAISVFWGIGILLWNIKLRPEKWGTNLGSKKSSRKIGSADALQRDYNGGPIAQNVSSVQ